MADTTISSDPVKQFSVFTENRVGRLFDLTSLLAMHHVHIMAVNVLDVTENAVVRLIVDDPDRTRELLVNNDYSYGETDILTVEISGETSLKQVLAALLEAEINIHYVYAFIKRPEGRSAFALHVEDAEIGAQALGHRGFKVLTQRDISR
ncbi:MAG TPA: acetolactate synthase [Opitutaceae bacterium]|nr:acetolactate synthase [Opitutaceae bacterium]